MKKFLSILLAAMMVLAMTAAYADFTITAPSSTVSHTYYVYQIFTGTMADNATGKNLGELKWGANAKLPAGATTDTLVTDEQLKALKDLETTATDTTKLAVILTYVDLTSTPIGTVTSGSTLTVAPGYYLITDSNAAENNPLEGKDDAATTHLVKVCANITIQPKTAKPSVDKQVQDETTDPDLNTTDTNGWGETADHEINESFKFKLIATLSADVDFASYDEYKVVFTDTMSKGVTFESIDSVKIGETVIPVKSDENPDGYEKSDITRDATTGAQTWTLTIADIKKFDTDLTNGAVIEVVYNAHLNEDAFVNTASGATTNQNKVELDYSNNPYTEGMGHTGPDYVWVFTYQVSNTKYSDNAVEGSELPGAGFTLYKGEAEVKLINNNDGTYTVANQNLTEGYVTEMESNADGKFDILGLDAGTYILKETTVPAGYNKCDDITITVGAVHNENADGTNNTTLTIKNGDASYSGTIINEQGATLPETGGIGTTLFYLIGGLMAAGSALTLVIRRRADADEE